MLSQTLLLDFFGTYFRKTAKNSKMFPNVFLRKDARNYQKKPYIKLGQNRSNNIWVSFHSPARNHKVRWKIDFVLKIDTQNTISWLQRSPYEVINLFNISLLLQSCNEAWYMLMDHVRIYLWSPTHKRRGQIWAQVGNNYGWYWTPSRSRFQG